MLKNNKGKAIHENKPNEILTEFSAIIQVII